MTDSLNSADKESTQKYCVSKAIPDGSNLYYATLYDEEKNKNIIISFHAFLNELNDIIYECSDPGVARIKFKWWLDEIESLKAGQPRHPVSKQILNCITIDNQTIAALTKTIEQIEQLLFFEQPCSLSDVLSFFKSSYGEMWQQCAIHLGLNKGDSLNTVQDMAATYHYLICLQQPHIYNCNVRCIIPSSCLSKAGLLQLKLNKPQSTSGQGNPFAQLISVLISKMNEINIKFKKNDMLVFRHGLILNRIAMKTAEEMLSDNNNIITTSTSLTPIRKLWLAWKTNLFI